MELGDQFSGPLPAVPNHPQLFEPPSGPANMTEWPDASKELRPTGPLPRQRSRQGIEIEHVGTVYPFLHAKDDVKHEAIPMLMSAREIMESYAPAEGDRMYHGTKLFVNGKVWPRGREDPRAGEPTERRMTTDHRLNQKWMDPATGERSFTRTSERIPPAQETDEQMWERKGVENRMGPDEAFEYRKSLYKANALASDEQIAKAVPPSGRTQSFEEHLRSTGDTGVIPLGQMPNPNAKPGDKRPMMAGGQHRIKAMMDINPDKLLPVEHWRNTFEAKMMPKPRGKPGEFVSRPGYT